MRDPQHLTITLWQRLMREVGFTSERAAEMVRVPRSTHYRWQKRVKEKGLKGLEDTSRRPKPCRRPE